jgi:hypothetical protein
VTQQESRNYYYSYYSHVIVETVEDNRYCSYYSYLTVETAETDNVTNEGIEYKRDNTYLLTFFSL